MERRGMFMTIYIFVLVLDLWCKNARKHFGDIWNSVTFIKLFGVLHIACLVFGMSIIQMLNMFKAALAVKAPEFKWQCVLCHYIVVQLNSLGLALVKCLWCQHPGSASWLSGLTPAIPASCERWLESWERTPEDGLKCLAPATHVAPGFH